MEFLVRYRADGVYHPVCSGGRKIGCADVQRIREEVGDPDLPLEAIRAGKEPVVGAPTLSVPEEVACRCRHFTHTHEVEVTVPGKSLNQFVRERVLIYRSPRTGEIVSARLVGILDERAILAAWEEANFPLKWDPSEEQG